MSLHGSLAGMKGWWTGRFAFAFILGVVSRHTEYDRLCFAVDQVRFRHCLSASAAFYQLAGASEFRSVARLDLRSSAGVPRHNAAAASRAEAARLRPSTVSIRTGSVNPARRELPLDGRGVTSSRAECG